MSTAPNRSNTRRILSLWFPRLAAERLLRAEPFLAETPFAVVSETGNLREIAALNTAASKSGLRRGQAMAEASTICPDLITRPADPMREAEFLAALRRWAGKFSPWVAEEAPDGLIVDLTGCAHLFGGEESLFAQVHQDCADLGLSLRGGIADTAGAAWALARYAGGGGLAVGRTGDAIDQEARATRSRATKRHWVKGGIAPEARVDGAIVPRIAPMGGTRQALSPLPIAALRVDADTVAGLARLGLRRIDDLWGMPRANLSRRFGQGLVLRLDQALGLQPEPISPAGAPLHFAVRLSLPEPIGLEGDILDGLDRLLPPLCAKLQAKGRGARQLRLEMFKAEGGVERIDLGLARPTDQPDDVRPLFALKLKGVDAGFGFDTLRLVAAMTEPLHKLQHKGGWAVAQDNKSRAAAQAAGDTGTALDDLITRIGTRVGLDNITRHRPADSHVPEKTSTRLAAAWSDAETDWPETARPRPLTLFAPEPVTAPTVPEVPAEFRWRGRRFETRSATGPERIAPEWWLDDPNWRSGVRDYWRITTLDGHLFWLFFAHGGTLSGGWFCQGDFC